MNHRVAVIGAGPMGLATAYQLIKDGHTPIVFEGDDRVGGMTATFDFSGQRIERYYHFHCTSDRDFILILNELGIADQLQWTKTKMGYWYQNRLQSWGNPLALLKFKGLSLQAKFRYGLHALPVPKERTGPRLTMSKQPDGYVVGSERKLTMSYGAACLISNSTTIKTIFLQLGYGVEFGA